MKFSIVINQRAVAEFNDGIGDKQKKLDLVDCAILDWIVAICSSRDEKIEQARYEGLTWISYKALLRDMPLLNISDKAAISRRVSRLHDLGFIRRKTVDQRTYVDFTVKTERFTYQPDFRSAQKPLTRVNGSAKTVDDRQRNRCSTSTDNNININNKKTKIHERERKVKDNLNISGRVRFLASRDFMKVKEDGQSFEDWFNQNRDKYQEDGG